MYAEIVRLLPKPAVRGIEQGLSYGTLEWVQTPNKQIARVMLINTANNMAVCVPQKACEKQA